MTVSSDLVYDVLRQHEPRPRAAARRARRCRRAACSICAALTTCSPGSAAEIAWRRAEQRLAAGGARCMLEIGREAGVRRGVATICSPRRPRNWCATAMG
ncbi:MAG: hypothetical protein MZV49_16710 [Rhodopseudomonas palustris]|nr:hypothetical protein [Rhodopseudomonas palustris]